MPGWRPFAWAVTFLAVAFAWVPFRAENTVGSIEILRSMALADGIDLPGPLVGRLVDAGVPAGLLAEGGERLIPVGPAAVAVLLLVSSLLATRCPNTAQICSIDRGVPAWLRFEARPWQAVAIGILLAFALLSVGQPSEFLYFNF